MFLGIDYGAKLAGTTAVCYLDGDELKVEQSEKKKDADAFVKRVIEKYQPESIFIDAPLSLPEAYFGKGDDYFFRACDRELRAMSPMFLGGLTARAMQLKHQHPSVRFFESYPAQLVRILELGDHYKSKKGNGIFCRQLERKQGIKLPESLPSWHAVDAILAWVCGYRYHSGKAIEYGDEKEGVVIV